MKIDVQIDENHRIDNSYTPRFSHFIIEFYRGVSIGLFSNRVSFIVRRPDSRIRRGKLYTVRTDFSYSTHLGG